MKIRTDFVTNSSSSSFVVYELEDCTELVKYVQELMKKHKIKEPYGLTIYEDAMDIKAETMIYPDAFYPDDPDYYKFCDFMPFSDDVGCLYRDDPARAIVALLEGFSGNDIARYAKPEILSDEEITKLEELCYDLDNYEGEYVLGYND